MIFYDIITSNGVNMHSVLKFLPSKVDMEDWWNMRRSEQQKIYIQLGKLNGDKLFCFRESACPRRTQHGYYRMYCRTILAMTCINWSVLMKTSKFIRWPVKMGIHHFGTVTVDREHRVAVRSSASYDQHCGALMYDKMFHDAEWIIKNISGFCRVIGGKKQITYCTISFMRLPLC